jgi:hypothetical protein
METPTEPEATRRRFRRLPVELKTDLRVLLPEMDQKRIHLHTCSLGGGGVMFTSPVFLKVGTLLQMRLFYYAHQIEFSAEVVWSGKGAGRKEAGFQCGVQFTQISQEDLLEIHQILETCQNRQSFSFIQ